MSTESLLQERQTTHGEYREHARCTQAIMRAVMTERNWEKLSDIQRESLHMFAHKMGRIAVGNPDEPDHWKDIAGYAVLVEQRLNPPNTAPTEAMVKRVLELPQNNIEEVPKLHGPALEAFNAAIAKHPAAPRPASFDVGGGRFEVGETCHYMGVVLCQITSILQDGEADIDCGEHGHKTVKWRTLSKLPPVTVTNTPRAGETEAQIATRERRTTDTPSCGDGLFDVHQRARAEERLKDWQQDAAESSLIRRTGQRTPEDGAQHASVTPWVVSSEFFTNSGISDDHVREFWRARTMSMFVLEPHCGSHTIPRVLRPCYNLSATGGWTLDIRKCPEDAREYFPSLGREKNTKELEELPSWQQMLYVWSDEGQKYVLHQFNVAWHVETE